MVHIIVMVAVVHVFSAVPLLAADRSSVGKSRSLSVRTQMVSPARFQQALLESIKNQFSIPDLALSVKVLFPKTLVEVPKGVLDIQVPPDTMNGLLGRRDYRMGLSVNQEFQRMVTVVAEIEARMQVVVPVRFIKAHETIGATDVKVTEYSLPNLTQVYIKGPDAVVGKKATRLLLPNRPIEQTFIAEAPVIHKGDRVIIEARHGGLLVQTVGIAKDSGEPGKMIAVENQQSKREVVGRVLEAGLVRVTF